MKIALRFILVQLKQSLIREIQFRVNFIINLLMSIIDSAMLLVFYLLIFSNNISFNLLSRGQLYFFIGTFLIINNIFSMFIQNGLRSLSGLIITGNLDGILIRPLNHRVILAFSNINISSISSIILGIILLIVSGQIFTMVKQPILLLIYFLSLILGVYFLYLLLFIVMCSAFFIIKTGELESIFTTALQYANKPYIIYPRWLQFVFSSIISIFIIGNFQVVLLTRGYTLNSIIITLISIVIWDVISRILWNIGLRKYQGASR